MDDANINSNAQTVNVTVQAPTPQSPTAPPSGREVWTRAHRLTVLGIVMSAALGAAGWYIHSKEIAKSVVNSVPPATAADSPSTHAITQSKPAPPDAKNHNWVSAIKQGNGSNAAVGNEIHIGNNTVVGGPGSYNNAGGTMNIQTVAPQVGNLHDRALQEADTLDQYVAARDKQWLIMAGSNLSISSFQVANLQFFRYCCLKDLNAVQEDLARNNFADTELDRTLAQINQEADDLEKHQPASMSESEAERIAFRLRALAQQIPAGSGQTFSPISRENGSINISGGTVTNPTVNNNTFVTPPKRVLAPQQMRELSDCIRGVSGSAEVVALMTDTEAQKYGAQWIEMFHMAQWGTQGVDTAVEDGVMPALRIKLHGKRDGQRAMFLADSPEIKFWNCMVVRTDFKAEVVINETNPTGKVEIDIGAVN